LLAFRFAAVCIRIFAITPPPIDNVILDTGPSPGQA